MQTQCIEQYVMQQLKQSPKLQHMVEAPEANGEYPELQGFSVMGLNEEAGEVAGLACRECYKKIQMPKESWLEELGDVLWYLTATTIAKGLTLEDLWQYNVKKLEERYGECRSKEL